MAVLLASVGRGWAREAVCAHVCVHVCAFLGAPGRGGLGDLSGILLSSNSPPRVPCIFWGNGHLRKEPWLGRGLLPLLWAQERHPAAFIATLSEASETPVEGGTFIPADGMRRLNKVNNVPKTRPSEAEDPPPNAGRLGPPQQSGRGLPHKVQERVLPPQISHKDMGGGQQDRWPWCWGDCHGGVAVRDDGANLMGTVAGCW